MKCITCKYFSNKNNKIGSCRLISKLDETQHINYAKADYATVKNAYAFETDEIKRNVPEEMYLNDTISVGVNFGCNNWMPLIKITGSSMVEVIEIEGSNFHT